jgi:mono/diheme cytochrome c family protein
MKNLIALTGTTLMFVSSLAAGQDTGAGEARGQLLYSTHCIACHTTQVHWRDEKLATDWTSLKFQVRRWQENVGLGLGEDDVGAIASYLNGLYYHFPATDAKQSGKADATPRVSWRHQD